MYDAIKFFGSPAELLSFTGLLSRLENEHKQAEVKRIADEEFEKNVRSNKSVRYQVLSPDGIAITHEDYGTKEEAISAFELWKERYVQQGYYSTNKWEKIAVEDLADYCSIEEV